MVTRIHQQHFTLLVEDRGAALMDDEGHRLARWEHSHGDDLYGAWMTALRTHVPHRSAMDLVLAHGKLQVHCQEVPPLTPRERRDAALRIAQASSEAESIQVGSALFADEGADGGHQLWVASQPLHELETWIGLLKARKADITLAVPLPYLIARMLPALGVEGRDALVLTVDPEGARVFFYRGHGLAFTRSFRLPDGLDPAKMAPGDEPELAEILSEELSRVLQFIKQKHRGVALAKLIAIGLSACSPEMRARLERSLHLPLVIREETLEAVILTGLHRERHRGDGLNLVPEEVLEARRIRTLRAATWVAAGAMVALCATGYVGLRVIEHQKRDELTRAEAQREVRRRAVAQRDSALRERFPLARVRMAEAHQVLACEQLEALALTLLGVPEGVVLASVDIQQELGDSLSWRFSVTGTALSEGRFSMGALAAYLTQVQAHPGVRLAPLQDVSVSDGRLADGSEVPHHRGVTRFTLQGGMP